MLEIFEFSLQLPIVTGVNMVKRANSLYWNKFSSYILIYEGSNWSRIIAEQRGRIRV